MANGHYAAKNGRARESARLVDSRPARDARLCGSRQQGGAARQRTPLGHQYAADSHGGWLWLLVSQLAVFSGVIFLALLRAMDLCAMRPPERSGIFLLLRDGSRAVGLFFLLFNGADPHFAVDFRPVNEGAERGRPQAKTL